jgi:hypothetical protein
MNYAIVIFSGVMLLSGVNYVFSARKIYKGPVAIVDGRKEG